MKLFTESWLDLTLSDPLQHSAAARDWQVAHDHQVKYQTRIARFLCFKHLNSSKISSTYPRPPISQPSLLKVQPLSNSQLSTSPPSPTKVHSPISQALLSSIQPSTNQTLLSTTIPISQPSLLKVQPLSSSQLSTSQLSPPKVHSPTSQALSSTQPSQPSLPKVQCLSSSQSSTGQRSPSKVLSPTNLTVLSNAQSTNKQSLPCTQPSFTNLPTSTISSSCSCKTICATKKCPCKANHIPCSAYCHPPKSCVNNLSSTEGKKVIIDLGHVQNEKQYHGQMCNQKMPL